LVSHCFRFLFYLEIKNYQEATKEVKHVQEELQDLEKKVRNFKVNNFLQIIFSVGCEQSASHTS